MENEELFNVTQIMCKYVKLSKAPHHPKLCGVKSLLYSFLVSDLGKSDWLASTHGLLVPDEAAPGIW